MVKCVRFPGGTIAGRLCVQSRPCFKIARMALTVCYVLTASRSALVFGVDVFV